MNATCYFAKNSPDVFERERLGLLTRLADPITTRRLLTLEVERGWNCLEVGAGDGSVARWLADRVGPEGRVVATDLDPRFLVEHDLPNLEVRRHDLVRDDLEAGGYDLVHCRFVLMHLSDPVRPLWQLAEAVRPGGWLLVEEMDLGSFGAADPGHPRAVGFNRRMQALHAALQDLGILHPWFGRRLPALVETVAGREVGHDGVTLIGRGGDPLARNRRMHTQLLRDRLVAAGVLEEADFDELDRAYDDPSFWFVGFTSVGAWGRFPGW
jgi:SAM-dependent methyltransferase